MRIWYSRTLAWFGLGGLTIQKGVQMGVPLSAPAESAAPVNFDIAMTVSAFWGAVRLISETMASMPLECWDVTADADGNVSRKRNTRNGLWRVLNYQPNRYQTRQEFFETLTLSLAVHGNCYCAIQRSATGDVIGLLPIMAGQVTVELDEEGDIMYTVYSPSGSVQVYSQKSIWHVKLFGNGIIGLSPLSYAAQSLGIAASINNRVAVMARNGGKTTGVLTIDKLLSPTQRARVRENFRDLEEGNEDGLFVLEAGMNYQQTSMTPSDLQLLETRRFQIEDIARFMGVPSVLINDTDAASTWGSGISEIIGGWFKLGLRPYIERFQSSIKRHLIDISEWEKVEIEFCFEVLLRMDEAARYKMYQSAIYSAVLRPNEARAREGLPSDPMGDKLYANGTLTPLGEKPAKPEPTGPGLAPVVGFDGGDNSNDAN